MQRAMREVGVNGRRVAAAATLAAVVFATAWAGVHLSGYTARIATVWLPNAVVLAVVLRSPRGRWRELLGAAAVANVAANLFNADPLFQAVALTAINIAEVSIAAVLLASLLRPPEGFAEPVDVANLRFLGALLLVCGLLAPALSASAALLLLRLPGGQPGPVLFLRWFLADGMGLLIITPLLLSIRFAPQRRMSLQQWAEVTLILLGLAALTFIVFHQTVSFRYLVLAGLVFASLRLTSGQTALAVVIVAGIAIDATVSGHGPAFAASQDPAIRILILQSFIAAALFLTLPIGAVLAERDRLIDRVAEKELQFRRLAEASPAGILQLGPDHLPLFANQRWTQLTGQALPFETAGQWLEAVDEEDRAQAARLWARARSKSEPGQTELRYRRADGTTAWADLSITPEQQPGATLTGWVVRLVDISERHWVEHIASQASAQLRESNRLLIMAEGLANLGHWRIDGRPLTVEFSAQASAILGIARREEIAAAEVLAIVDRRDRRTLLGALVRARANGGPESCCIRFRPRGGATRYVRVEIQADPQRSTGSASLFGVMRDTTDMFIAEQKLIAARDDAEAATRAKSEFLATMSHEIRTPMTGVMGMIELLRGKPSEDERKRYLSAMKQSAELLMAVLDGILDFSKVESGMMELDCRDFDFQALLEHTVDMFQNAASKKGLIFDLTIECGASPIVHGDPVRLQQVVSNLISNAIKFTEHGRVALIAQAKSRRGQRQMWRVEISDTGVGIAADELEQLFEPFVQKGQMRFGGTGLGLAISRRLIEAMGGKTGVRSRPSRGSTFWFQVSLPIGSEAAADAAPAASTEIADGRSLHVLVAEDNPINQMLIGAMVRRLGHRVTCVDNGRRALDAAQAVAFDAILIDMQMPEMDGIAATRAIRLSGGRNALVPIIALTADAAPERRRFYENAGLTAFMTKPIDVDLLQQHLARAAGDGKLPQVQLPADESPIDESRLTELRNILGPAKLHSLLEMLGVELSSRPALLRSAAAADRVDDLRSQAHSLKGAVDSLGVVGVARAAKAVELAMPGPELELAMARLDCEVAHARLAISRLLDPPARASRRTA